MIKQILIYPKDKEKLSQKSEKVTEINDEIKELIQNLKDTMHAIPFAKGISAIQIGIPKQICVVNWGGDEYTLINPSITRSRGQQDFLEGCLSVPGKQKKVPRAQKIWCSYLDIDGKECEIAQGGRMSDIIQHELDHFDGECKVYEEK